MSESKRIVALSTDTAHHRYFLNTLTRRGIALHACLFESEHVEPPFPVGPLFEEEQDRWEAERFFTDVPRELPDDLDIRTVSTVNTPEAMDLIRRLEPDWGIVFGTGKIQPGVIDLFPDGLVNVHRGIAQRYRGLDSDLWAIYHRDWDSIGVTIHEVDRRLDTGDVVAQGRLALQPGMKTHQLRYYTTLLATELVADAAHRYLTDTLRAAPQARAGRYYSFMPLDLKRIVRARFDSYCERLS